jgi:hypothetical protein
VNGAADVQLRCAVLIEPHAANRGGHWSKALPLLAAAATAAGRRCVVIGAAGVHPELRAEVEERGADVLEHPAASVGLAAVLLAGGRLLDRLHASLQPRIPHRLLPYQLQRFGRCLTEAGSLRIARDAVGRDGGTTVILTASDTLPALAVALGGMSHVRYLHDVPGSESRSIRVVERLLRPMLRRTAAVCPTDTIAEALHDAYPTISSSTQTFALLDPDAYVSEPEREAARSELKLPPSVRVGSLIGGWWRAKDPTTLVRALASVSEPFVMLVAGYRMDAGVLEQMRAAHRGELRVVDKQLSGEELRRIYAASDFTIVSRHANGKESGIAFDAISYGVPVIVSDHEPGLTRAFGGKPWARVFRSGDPEQLAQALGEASTGGLPRPPRSVAHELGMLDAGEMLSSLDEAMPRKV